MLHVRPMSIRRGYCLGTFVSGRTLATLRFGAEATLAPGSDVSFSFCWHSSSFPFAKALERGGTFRLSGEPGFFRLSLIMRPKSRVCICELAGVVG